MKIEIGSLMKNQDEKESSSPERKKGFHHEQTSWLIEALR